MKYYLVSLLSLSLLLTFSFQAVAQQISAVRISEGPKIDGLGNDMAWEELSAAYSGNFTQLAPNNLEPSQYTTEIKIAYTDYAFYVLARMHDPRPGSIPRELGLRDQWGRNADLFAIVLDTYNKGQNAFYLGVTAAGVQLDSYLTPQYEDDAWDAVWNSAVSFSEEGWVAEFEIPYSAIRFPKTEQQSWGANFIRRVQRDNEEASWSPVDNSISGFVNQSGQLQGIRNVEPPLRLQLFPYVSTVVGIDANSGEAASSFGGGMDLKYGINESFTLDMSLVPDFSQVQSDNLVLNLSPYEVQYSENRPFFTEGIDLFNKGGLFYSRRVGRVFNSLNPIGQLRSAGRSVEVLASPAEAQLLNASKLSGRTRSGVGLGFFNALTDQVHARVMLDDSTEQEVMLDPVTNFNVMVVDKNLKNNSNISLINTNVSRFNGAPDANVTGMDFRINTKDNTYRVEGFAAYSHTGEKELERGRNQYSNGYTYTLRAGKVSGNFQFGAGRTVESDTYNSNDLGFLQAANEVSHSLNLSYNLFKPFWIFNRLSYNIDLGHERLYEPKEYASFFVGNNFYLQFKNFWSMGGWLGTNPIDSYDFFEPRAAGYRFTRAPSYNTGIWISSDSRKRLSLDFNYGVFERPSWNSFDYWYNIEPRLRISDQFSIRHSFSVTQVSNERGYANSLEEDGREQIIFGSRDMQVVENSSSFNFIFTNKMGLSLRMRHYWNKVAYNRFYELERDGSLIGTDYTGLDAQGQPQHDVNFNTFNLDLVYNWQIAPGSFLTFAWKDAILQEDERVWLDFGENLNALRSVPQQNTFSVKLTYFVDYLMLKRLF